VIVEYNEEQDENAFLIDIMCQFRRYIVQKKHSEVSKTLEELIFRRRYLYYSFSCFLLDLERENEEYRLDYMLMCVIRVGFDSLIWEI